MSGEELIEKIRSELEPFLDGIRTEHADVELFKQAYSDFITRYKRARRLLDIIIPDFEHLKILVKEDARLRDIYWLFLYLGLVESLGNCVVDMIVMLLVANGRDFHIECAHATPRIRHAGSINDLEKERVPLTTKLNFLRDNGISTLASIVDSKLRNAIAHLKFDVKEDKIFIKGKPAFEVTYSSVEKLAGALMITEKWLRLLALKKGVFSKTR